MDGIQYGQLPFNGNYIDHEGIIRNIDGFVVNGDGIQHNMVPMNGNFYDSNNKIKNLDVL
ncbi:MAG: hypothetical protein LBD57_04495 [Endomicrobium sp.]|jgi:hypothetical protein|uniref:hypothetical protein n=1 Tax=Candidatus Endomicrobiellum cubanum TaxID=3242325 RepID=UPI002827A433|nr:hypothetical protein [Endomicrobium sp.]